MLVVPWSSFHSRPPCKGQGHRLEWLGLAALRALARPGWLDLTAPLALTGSIWLAGAPWLALGDSIWLP